MEYKDYYKTLGISRSASAEEIRAAYRKLARQYHPDHNPGNKQAEDRFKEINEAYQALSDPQKRARYDQFGNAYSDWQGRGAPAGGFNWDDWVASGGAGGAQQVDFNDLFGAGGGAGFSDFFRSIFGGADVAGRNPAYRARRAPSAEHPVAISLDEAYNGVIRLLEIDGRRVQVRIPPGAKTGTKVRIPDSATGVGDVYLKITVNPDPRFERDGDNLTSHISIDLFTALLGGEAEVHTLGGKVTLTIPPGTQPEQRFRLSGRGMPRLKTPEQKGDLYVRAHVHLPKNLSETQKDLLREIRSLS